MPTNTRIGPNPLVIQSFVNAIGFCFSFFFLFDFFFLKKVKKLNQKKNMETYQTLVVHNDSVFLPHIYIYIYILLYIIVEAERKLIPTIKKALTNRITAYLKFKHV